MQRPDEIIFNMIRVGSRVFALIGGTFSLLVPDQSFPFA